MPLRLWATISDPALRRSSRRRVCLLGLVVAGAGAVFASAAIGSGAPGGHAFISRPRCLPKKSRIVARHGSSVLFLRQTGPDDGKYGAPHTLYGCRGARQAPAVLFDFEDGDVPSIVVTVFNGPYAAFFLGWQASTCAFYESAGAENCSQPLFESVNLSNGHTRARVTNEDPNTTEPPSALVVTHSGWIAWVARLTSTSAPLLARDSKGEHVLDSGPIDAGSLRVSGKRVRWTDAAVAHAAVLG